MGKMLCSIVPTKIVYKLVLNDENSIRCKSYMSWFAEAWWALSLKIDVSLRPFSNSYLI